MSAEFLLGLARPVRHEANNLLAAISGTAEMMLRAAGSEREAARAARIKEAAARLSALLQAYLALAAPPAEGEAAPAVVEAMRPLVMLMLGPGSRVETEVAADLPTVALGPAELQAAVLGLARRAAAAAPEGGGLRVSLAAAPGGAVLRVAPLPAGEAPPPLFLPAAGR